VRERESEREAVAWRPRLRYVCEREKERESERASEKLSLCGLASGMSPFSCLASGMRGPPLVCPPLSLSLSPLCLSGTAPLSLGLSASLSLALAGALSLSWEGCGLSGSGDSERGQALSSHIAVSRHVSASLRASLEAHRPTASRGTCLSRDMSVSQHRCVTCAHSPCLLFDMCSLAMFVYLCTCVCV
jgi:hypothetical protein